MPRGLSFVLALFASPGVKSLGWNCTNPSTFKVRRNQIFSSCWMTASAAIPHSRTGAFGAYIATVSATSSLFHLHIPHYHACDSEQRRIRRYFLAPLPHEASKLWSEPRLGAIDLLSASGAFLRRDSATCHHRPGKGVLRLSYLCSPFSFSLQLT
jgi:hypothetical protein